MRGIGWLEAIHEQDADHVLSQLREETATKGSYEGQFRLQSPLGKIIWVKANAMSVYRESGETDGLIMTFGDITGHLNNERRLKDIAEKDQLTGLVNRAFFNDRLENALNNVRRAGSVALMFIDLDEFKHINDTLGHDSGDSLLCQVAVRLKDCLRDADTIARIGGDEFTVILNNVHNPHTVAMVADKLVEALTAPFVIAERSIYVTCTIGIAIAQSDGVEPKALMKQADVALYKAKEAGRNQYKFYSSELNKDANVHVYLRNSLRDPAREDFYVVYQPQVNAETGQIIGLEALSRWEHEEVDAIGPSQFVKMIEESGLVPEFSTWLFNDVFSTINRWEQHAVLGDHLKVSINLSAKQFRNKELAALLYQQAQRYGVSPTRIILELTETALIDDPALVGKTLTKLKKMGFGLSLDDFGTGYSSLAYLRKLPLDSLKIDRSFIEDVLHDEDDAIIVKAIIHLAKTLKLDVIAEGVENSDTKSWLIGNGCPIQQGYYFDKPMSLEHIETLLKIPPKLHNIVDISKGMH